MVTGAGSGIGRALAEQLVRRGCAVAMVDVREDALKQAACEIEAALVTHTPRGRLSLHVVDVSSRDAMQALPEQVVDTHGGVDLLINNAGIISGYTFEEHPIEHFERLVQTNLMGVVYGCKFFLPHLKARSEAHIVNLSSMFGLIGIPTQAAYAASKFGIRGLSEVLWVELAASGIGVTCVFPGGVHTNLIASAPGWQDGADVATQQFDQVVRRTPEQAAERILRAVERKQPQLRLGAESLIIDWLKRLFPRAPHRFMAAQQRKQAGRSRG